MGQRRLQHDAGQSKETEAVQTYVGTVQFVETVGVLIDDTLPLSKEVRFSKTKVSFGEPIYSQRFSVCTFCIVLGYQHPSGACALIGWCC